MDWLTDNWPWLVHHDGPEPVAQPGPVVGPYEDDRERGELVRPHQVQGLEQLVQRPIAARQADEGARVLDERQLPEEEVVKRHAEPDVGVRGLACREVDREADGAGAVDDSSIGRALVAGRHEAGSPAGDHGEARLGQEPGRLAGPGPPVRDRSCPGGAEHRDAAPDRTQRAECLEGFVRDPSDPSGIIVAQSGQEVASEQLDSLGRANGLAPAGATHDVRAPRL